MDGITSSPAIAFLGSVLAHAAFGAAMFGLGPVTESLPAAKNPDEMVYFDVAEPSVEPESPPLLDELPAVRRVVRSVAPRSAPVEAPPPAAEPPPLAPTVAPENAPVAVAPVAGLATDAMAGTEAKGFAAGTAAVGAKAGTEATPTGAGAVSLRGVAGGIGDRSRAAGLADGRNWDCSFPQEAEDEGVDGARVTLEVQIGADSAVHKATVVSDPGHGFGQEARRCALRRRWLSQLDAHGAPTTGRALVVVNFVR